jgi:hypothetical protein
MSELSPQEELVERAAAEVDESLIEWYLQRSTGRARDAAVLPLRLALQARISGQ